MSNPDTRRNQPFNWLPLNGGKLNSLLHLIGMTALDPMKKGVGINHLSYTRIALSTLLMIAVSWFGNLSWLPLGWAAWGRKITACFASRCFTSRWLSTSVTNATWKSQAGIVAKTFTRIRLVRGGLATCPLKSGSPRFRPYRCSALLSAALVPPAFRRTAWPVGDAGGYCIFRAAGEGVQPRRSGVPWLAWSDGLSECSRVKFSAMSSKHAPMTSDNKEVQAPSQPAWTIYSCRRIARRNNVATEGNTEGL